MTALLPGRRGKGKTGLACARGQVSAKALGLTPPEIVPTGSEPHTGWKRLQVSQHIVQPPAMKLGMWEEGGQGRGRLAVMVGVLSLA